MAAALLLAACGGSGQAVDADQTPVKATSTPTPTTSPKLVPVSILSGRPGTDGPVLAVKIDNVRSALPHVGLNAADVVYVSQVEGGLTRIGAVFSSEIPPKVGPVRSARVTDLELFQQYGRFAFAYSGANSQFRPRIAAAPLYDVSGDRSGVGYWREPGRRAPHDFLGDPARLLARAPQAEKPRDVGFRFAATPPPGGRPATAVTATYPGARIGFTYDPATKRWLYSLDGRADAGTSGPAGASTVIVQYAKVTPSRYGSGSNNTPFTATVGSGDALILRDGLAYDATWQRAAADKPTRFLVGGRDLALAPGQVWVVLLDDRRTATVT